MLGQGQLRSVFREQIPTPFKWVLNGFCQCREMGRQWAESGLGGTKVGLNWSKPTFYSLADIFWDIGWKKNLRQFTGGWRLFSERAARQP